MKTICLLLLILINSFFLANGQAIKPVTVKDLPSELNIKGVVKNIYQWVKGDTLNYIIYSTAQLSSKHSLNKDGTWVSKYGVVHTADDSAYTTEYYVYYFIKTQDSSTLQWRIFDFIKECDFDTHFRFINDALSVTDLDNDGTNEIWVMYSLNCTSDVSPAELKLIMYEGKQKYAIRGYTREYEHNPVKEMDSPKTIDIALKNGNADCKEYAIKLWKQNNVLVLSQE